MKLFHLFTALLIHLAMMLLMAVAGVLLGLLLPALLPLAYLYKVLTKPAAGLNTEQP